MGLAILCKHLIIKHFSLFNGVEDGNSIAHNIVFEKEVIRFSVTNVHFSWDSVM